MKFVSRGASRVAIVAGLASVCPAWAQQAPDTVQTAQPSASQEAAPQVESTEVAAQQPTASDRVVITGSLIATAPEDAPKPVEVFTADDLKEQGSPNITEFLRALTANNPNTTGVAGTSTSAGVLGNGFVSMDLRGQGANGSLVLMNGRRLATTNGGAGADVNTIPVEALQAVEVLKDGASATYGAGAVGGVVNFRTRRDIDAPQITVNRTLYDGSKGGYELNFLTGWVGDAGNVLISLSHEAEDSLLGNKRDFGNVPYALNPDGWSLTNLPNRFHRQSNWTTAAPTNAVLGSGGGTVFGSTNDFTSNADCAALGGALVQDLQQGTGATTPTACSFPLSRVTELVSESKQDQAFAEFNFNLSETMELHFDVLYSKYESTGRRPPSSGGSTTRVADSSVSATCSTTCMYIVPFQQNVYTTTGAINGAIAPVVNPFIADYNARQPGATNDLAAGGALLTSSQWRPYLFGGNPLFGNDLAESKVQRERLQLNAGMKGEFAEESLVGGLLGGVKYDIAGQFNQYIQTNALAGDWLASRLQDAMMGYGGSGCQAIDRVRTDYSSAAAYNRTIGIQSDTAPGTNGCMWFNPFQSNFQTSIFNGATNPNFPTGTTSPQWGANATQAANTGPTGFLNNLALLDWIWADRTSEVQYQSGTFDAVFTGEIPEAMFTLPGGEIGWALGGQWRQTERRGTVVSDDPAERAFYLAPCPYTHTGQTPQPPLPPGQPPLSRGCAGANGTGDFFSGATRLQPNPGLNPPDYVDSQTLAYFGEVQLPVLDTLNFSASARREVFNGGKISGNIWSLAGKWDITDNFYVRGSFGTNFRAEEALDASPGAQVITTVTDNTRFGTGYIYQRITTTEPNIGIEEDTTMNIGVGFDGDLFGGRLRASVDYFEIEVTEEVVTSLATTVLDNVFYETSAGGPNPETDPSRLGSPNERADCSARLISFIQFNGGVCTQGVTTANDIAAVLSSELNGPSFQTNGIDYSIDYSYPLFDGTLAASFNATQNLVYEAGAYSINGVVFDQGGDRLGFRNALRSGSASQELRANATISWANDEHFVSLRGNFQSGFEDDPGATYTPIVNLAGTANDVFSTYGRGRKDYIDYDLTYIYTAPFWQDLEFRASILNLTDRDPPAEQSINGYIAQMGNPRGRRLELGVTKKF